MTEITPRALTAVEALARADEAGRKAVAEAVTPDPQTEANEFLERECAAESGVDLVMRQLGLQHPTLLSTYTKREVARLYHALHKDPMAEIKLGGQFLGAGFAKPLMRTATVSEALRRTTVTVGGGSPVELPPGGGGGGGGAGGFGPVVGSSGPATGSSGGGGGNQ